MSVISEYFKEKADDVTDIVEDLNSKIDNLLEKIGSDKEKEEEETVVEDETPPPVDNDNSDTLEKLKKSLDTYNKSQTKASSKVYKGKDLVGNPSSMGAFGPLGKSQQSVSPLFANLLARDKNSLSNIDSQISALRKLLQGGVNV